VNESRAPSARAGCLGGPGLVQADGPGVSITFRRLLHHPIQEVWGAVTEPAQVEAWAAAKLTREDVPGGRLEIEHANKVRVTGKVLEWRPPRTYEYELHVPSGRGDPEGEASVIRWELTPAEGGTLLVMTHRRLTREAASGVARAFPGFLDRLTAHLDR
jgi:uncharacterized protein YndB with AHSA1/START domain